MTNWYQAVCPPFQGLPANKEGSSMNLLHLEYFREVAMIEHVQRTGEKLHVSPSAISAGIRSLEQELGVQLFDRVGRNMRLSEYGRQFLPYVEEAFAALDHGVEALHAAQGRHSKNVRFSVQDGALWNYLLIPFSAKYPDINIHQISREPDRQGKLMDQANLDFILTDLNLDNSNLEHCELFQSDLVVGVPKGHPLAQQGEVSIFDLQNDLFLFRPKTDAFQQYVDQILDAIGFQPSKIRVMEYMLRFRMFQEGPGVIITTQRIMERETALFSHAAYLKIREFADFPLVKKLYWKKSPPLSPSAEIFRDYFREETQHGVGNPGFF